MSQLKDFYTAGANSVSEASGNRTNVVIHGSESSSTRDPRITLLTWVRRLLWPRILVKLRSSKRQCGTTSRSSDARYTSVLCL